MSASRPGRFTPRERAAGTHQIGGWVGPRDGLDAVVKRKIPIPYIRVTEEVIAGRNLCPIPSSLSTISYAVLTGKM